MFCRHRFRAGFYVYIIGNFFGKDWSEQSFVFCFVNIFLGCIDISMVGHICHSLTQTKNNVKVEELFEDNANYPEPEDAILMTS